MKGDPTKREYVEIQSKEKENKRIQQQLMLPDAARVLNIGDRVVAIQHQSTIHMSYGQQIAAIMDGSNRPIVLEFIPYSSSASSR